MRIQQRLELSGLILHMVPTLTHLLLAPHGPIIQTMLLLPQWGEVSVH